MKPSAMTASATRSIAGMAGLSILALFGALIVSRVSAGENCAEPIRANTLARLRPGAGPDNWRIGEPVRYENLSIFPLISKSESDTSRFETLDEGLASGDVLVTEQENEILRRSRDGRPIPTPAYNSGAAVNQLVLINRGKRPVLLLAGEVVSGGNQDRIVGKDRIVPIGGEPLPLDVFCVEHGRWTGESTKFGAANLMVHPSVREKAAVESDQQQVWNAVRVGSTAAAAAPPPAPRTTGNGDGAGVAGGALGETSQTIVVNAAPITLNTLSATIAKDAPTQAYRKIYQSPQISKPVDEFAGEVRRRFARATSGLKGEAVVGVVVAYGGEVAWSDAFASPDLFKQYWPKLLRSYVVEALARPATKEEASLDDARIFLEHASGHVREESEPGVYVWRERSEGQFSEIELDSLAPSTVLLHWMKVLRTN
jgi:hypothetical protein